MRFCAFAVILVSVKKTLVYTVAKRMSCLTFIIIFNKCEIFNLYDEKYESKNNSGQ